MRKLILLFFLFLSSILIGQDVIERPPIFHLPLGDEYANIVGDEMIIGNYKDSTYWDVFTGGFIIRNDSILGTINIGGNKKELFWNVGYEYLVYVDVNVISGSLVMPYDGVTAGEIASTSGIYTYRYSPNTTNMWIFSTNFNGNIDSISIKPLLSQDISGNQNHAVNYGVTDTTDRYGNRHKAYYFDGTNDSIKPANLISFADNKPYTIGYWYKSPNSFPAASGFLGYNYSTGKRNQLYHSMSNDGLIFINSTNNSVILNYTFSVSTWYYITIVCDGSTTANIDLYINGNKEDSETIANSDLNIQVIGNRGKGSNDLDGILSDFEIYDYALTQGQVNNLYKNSSYNYQTPSIDVIRNYPHRFIDGTGKYCYPNNNVIINGTFNTDSDWSKGTGWSISGGTASCDGSQTGNTLLYQAYTFVNKKTYYYEFTVSGYSAGTLRTSYPGSYFGTTISANGTYSGQVSIDNAASNLVLYFTANVDFIGNIDNVIVKMDNNERDTLYCLSSGTIAFENMQAGSGYGTHEFGINKANASINYINFISDRIGGTNQIYGYQYIYDNTELVTLKRVNLGSATELFRTPASYITHSTNYKVKIIRRTDNQFTTYINDTLITDIASGSNPITDATYTDANYIVFDLDAGDKIFNYTYSKSDDLQISEPTDYSDYLSENLEVSYPLGDNYAVNWNNVITDSEFNTACAVNWYCQAGVTIGGGVATYTAVAANNGVYELTPPEIKVGDQFYYEYTISNHTTGYHRPFIGSSGTQNTGNGTFSGVHTSSGISAQAKIQCRTAPCNYDIDNFIVKKIDGKSQDISGNSNHATNYGVTDTTNRFGEVNSAYYFDGTNDSMSITNSVNYADNEAGSISYWWKTPAVFSPGHSSYATSIISGHSTLYYQDGVSTMYWYNEINDNETWSLSLNENTWYHICLTWSEDATSNMYLYVNGVSHGLNTTSNTVTSIGRLGGTVGGNQFKGILDEFKTWNKELTPAQAMDLYRQK